MRNYFYKIGFFEIDSKKLYDEWHAVGTKNDMFNRTENFVGSRTLDHRASTPFYYKLLINYPSTLDENIDPVWLDGSDDNHGAGDDATFTINNIMKDFQNSYTAEVVSKVNEFLKTKYKEYRTTVIKYAVLKPNSYIREHVDKSSIPRFFLSVNAPKGCYMEVCGEKHSLSETGALFRLMCNVPHSPINNSDDYRLMISFDVVPVQK